MERISVAPSVGALLEEVSGLAEEVFRSGKECALLGIWYELLPASRDAAYRWAQEAYGLPGATMEERESPEGLLHFWGSVKATLEAALLYDPIETLPLHRGDFGGSSDGAYSPGKRYPFRRA